MKYKITWETDYLRAELLEQQTPEELRSFLGAVFWASMERLQSRILICAGASTPLFAAESDEVLPYLKRIAWHGSNRIVVVAASGLRNEHLETRARQQGINLWSFPDEAAAIRWLRDRRRGYDRRRAPRRIGGGGEPRDGAASPSRMVEDRRRDQDRRQAQRRIVAEALRSPLM